MRKRCSDYQDDFTKPLPPNPGYRELHPLLIPQQWPPDAENRRAIGEYIIRGIKTTIPFQDVILRDPDFVRGKYDTGFVARFLESGVAKLKGQRLRLKGRTMSQVPKQPVVVGLGLELRTLVLKLPLSFEL